MKIIQPGIANRKWVLRRYCTGWGNTDDGCNALLELEYEDLFYSGGTFDDGQGITYPAVKFICPCCNVTTSLGRNDWPAGYSALPDCR